MGGVQINTYEIPTAIYQDQFIASTMHQILHIWVNLDQMHKSRDVSRPIQPINNVWYATCLDQSRSNEIVVYHSYEGNNKLP